MPAGTPSPADSFDDFIGIVCGTGFNASYVEENRNIRKLAGLDQSGSQVVNTESGSFALSPSGAIDDMYDATTATPSRYRHEKMISGAYLGHLGLIAMQQAAAAGCFSPVRSERSVLSTSSPPGTSTTSSFTPTARTIRWALSALRLPADDRRDMVSLLDALVERASVLVAITISAVILKTGKGRDPEVPVCVTVDGTTYWELASFDKRVQSHLGRLLTGERQRAWEITPAGMRPFWGPQSPH